MKTAKKTTEQTEEVFNISSFVRLAEILPSTVNEDDRTFDVIFSTKGSRVRRDGFFSEPFIEELSLDPKHVRLGRLNNGAPFLNTHNRFELDAILGVVEGAAVDGKRGVAQIRFSKREEVQPIFKDIKDGIIRNISVGYQVHKFEEIGRDDDDVKILRAIDWEPGEISAVSIGADDGAKVREADLKTNDCVLVRHLEGSGMKDKDLDKVDGKVVVGNEGAVKKVDDVKRDLAPSTEAVERAAQEATLSERKRVSGIRKCCRAAGYDSAREEGFIEAGTDLNAVREVVMDELAKQNEEVVTTSKRIEVGSSDKDCFRTGVEGFLLHRGNPGVYKLDDNASRFRGLSLLDICRESVRSMGGNPMGMSKMDLAAAACNMPTVGAVRALHGTSDFPEILANVANKSLINAYQAAPQTFMPITRMATISDFKPVKRVQLGDAPSLELVAPNGEVTRGTIGENAEGYQLATYAKIMGLTRVAIINDDLDAFTRLPEMWGRAARDLESDLVWGQITSNPTMGDGTVLFHANHGNLGTAGVISVTTLGEGRKLMKLQTGLDGRLINVMAKYLIVPATQETLADQFVTLITPQQGINVNPFMNRLTVLSEPRLDSDSTLSWYLAAEKGQLDIIELGKLEGQDGPRLETRAGFEVEGVEFKAAHDVAAKVIDHRGLVKNAGA